MTFDPVNELVKLNPCNLLLEICISREIGCSPHYCRAVTCACHTHLKSGFHLGNDLVETFCVIHFRRTEDLFDHRKYKRQSAVQRLHFDAQHLSGILIVFRVSEYLKAK